MKKFNKLFCIILILCSIKTIQCMDANDALTNSALYSTNAEKYLKYVKLKRSLNEEASSFLQKRFDDANKILSGNIDLTTTPLNYLDSKRAYILSLPFKDAGQRTSLDKIELTKKNLAHLKNNPHARMVYYYGLMVEKNVKSLLQIKLRCRVGKRDKLDKLYNIKEVSQEEYNEKIRLMNPKELINIQLEASRNFAQAVLDKLR